MWGRVWVGRTHAGPLRIRGVLMAHCLILFRLCSLTHRWGLSHWTLDPEELGTSPTVTQLTAAIPVAEAWCLVFGSGYRGQHWTVPRRAQRRPPWWDACPEAPAPWPARLGVGCSLPACLAAGHSLGLGAFALYSGLKEGGQVTNVVALSPALSFPMLLFPEGGPSAEGVRNGELQVAGEIPGPSCKDHPPTPLTGSLTSGMQTEQDIMGPDPQGSLCP